jgi:hypothetical protein
VRNSIYKYLNCVEELEGSYYGMQNITTINKKRKVQKWGYEQKQTCYLDHQMDKIGAI